ncbi:hypothetical protein [Nocardia testacea]|uniref:hypothetical protein n=1 Tax=Nocardia testacea TaxID=248551 RepID=UPI0033CEF9E8
MAVKHERTAQKVGEVFELAAELPVFGVRVSGDTNSLIVDAHGNERDTVLAVGVS